MYRCRLAPTTPRLRSRELQCHQTVRWWCAKHASNLARLRRKTQRQRSRYAVAAVFHQHDVSVVDRDRVLPLFLLFRDVRGRCVAAGYVLPCTVVRKLVK